MTADLVELLGYPSVTLILGRRGSGKSAFGYRALEDAHARGLPCCVMGLPPSKAGLLPDWIEVADDPRRLPDQSAVFVDEAYMLMFARESMAAFNKLMAKLMGITRQRDQLFLFATHLTRKLDVGVVYDSDNIVFRQPSHLHARFERPELEPMLREADRFFRTVPDPVRWAYVVTERGTFKVEVELPSFWTDELSRAFAAVSLEPEAAPEAPTARDLEALRRIAEFERGMDDYHRRLGWQATEVGLSGGQLVRLISLGLVRRAYTSRSTKCFLLTERGRELAEGGGEEVRGWPPGATG
jgi:hypothetical protein